MRPVKNKSAALREFVGQVDKIFADVDASEAASFRHGCVEVAGLVMGLYREGGGEKGGKAGFGLFWLLTALSDLDYGTVHPVLKPKRLNHRAPDSTLA